jgi:hypothetical protein
MLNRQLPDLREQDFASLVTGGVAEGRDLEFKRDLPGSTDGDLKEFLADVTSLANAQGGDLIFGIEDRGGVATAVRGIDGQTIDNTLLRLESIVRDGVEPRMTMRMQWVSLENGRGVLVLRVPASLAAPHRIRFKNNGRFWTRNSRGKYEMDVHELRHAFTQSEAMPQRLRQLHDEAVSAAEGVDMPFALGANPVAVFSVMPLGLLRERRDLALTPEHTMLPAKTRGANSLPTLEGILWYSPPSDGNIVRAYTLTHRTGRIDAAWAFGGTRQFQNGDEARLVWASSFEEGVTEMAVHGVGRLQSYGIDGPWVIMVTAIGIRGAAMVCQYDDLSRPAWRDRARLPELILDRVSEESLLPIFRAFWFLFGMTRPA